MPLNSERWIFKSKKFKRGNFLLYYQNRWHARFSLATAWTFETHPKKFSRLYPDQLPLSSPKKWDYFLVYGLTVISLQLPKKLDNFLVYSFSFLHPFLWHLYLVSLQFLAKLPHHGPQLTWIYQSDPSIHSDYFLFKVSSLSKVTWQS